MQKLICLKIFSFIHQIRSGSKDEKKKNLITNLANDNINNINNTE